MSEGQGEGVIEVVPPVAVDPPPAPPIDSRISPVGVALFAVGLAMPTYLALSMIGSVINFALSVVLAQLGLLAVVVIVLRLSRRSITRFTGLVGSRPRAYLLGAAVGLGNTLLFNGPLHVFARHFFPEWLVKMFDMSELLRRMDFMPVEMTAFFVAAVLMAPLIEELLFRGVFFRGLAEWNPQWAAVITAVVFSAYHLDPVGFLARLQIGLLLAWLFWRTKSLGACIAAHAANNLFAVGGMLLFANSDHDPTEPVTLVDWLPVLAVGASIFVPAVVALVRSAPSTLALPADDPEAPRRSFFAEVLPWATALMLLIALVLRLDGAGAQLTIIDLTNPLRAAKTPGEHHEREVLQRMRRGARNGTGSVSGYTELRRELARREGR